MTTYTSTINPLLPAMDAPIASAPVRGNFAAAVNDIDFIYGLIAALPTAGGTVTSVAGTNSNGITWSVSNPTTTANITISLGAITPTSVNGISFSGSSTPMLEVIGTCEIEGSNTGDQTINLTGDVTGTGTGTFSTTLATVNSDVGIYTNATVQADAKGRILSISSGDVTALTFGDITSGTNTAQTLVIGTGSTLSASSNGTITATTNANLTGPITSVGNATSIGAQTGTGSTFVMSQSPTINEPVIVDGNLGTPSQITLTNANGTAALLTAGAVLTISDLISAGSNVAITGSGTQASPYSIAASGGGGVSSIDGITGAITLVAGSNITIQDNTPSAGHIKISASGGGGSSILVYATFSSTHSTAGTENVVECTSGTFTLTLTNPTVAAGQAWQTYFKNSGSGVVTLSGTIDGASSWVLGAGSSVILVFNGTSWLVF